MGSGKYWWIKVIGLMLALAGVLWVMSSLQSGSYFNDPSSPVQLLIGAQPGTVSGASAEGIPAKVEFQKAEPTSTTRQ